jgi:hypothetical protein
MTQLLEKMENFQKWVKKLHLRWFAQLFPGKPGSNVIFSYFSDFYHRLFNEFSRTIQISGVIFSNY